MNERCWGDPSWRVHDHRILCIGAGYVGGHDGGDRQSTAPTCRWSSRHQPGACRRFGNRAARPSSARTPRIVQASLGRNLRFTADVEQAIRDAECSAVDTPGHVGRTWPARRTADHFRIRIALFDVSREAKVPPRDAARCFWSPGSKMGGQPDAKRDTLRVMSATTTCTSGQCLGSPPSWGPRHSPRRCKEYVDHEPPRWIPQQRSFIVAALAFVPPRESSTGATGSSRLALPGSRSPGTILTRVMPDCPVIRSIQRCRRPAFTHNPAILRSFLQRSSVASDLPLSPDVRG